MPRFLFAIPHYFSNPEGGTYHGSESGHVAWRAGALRKTVLSLHQTYGSSQCMMQLNRRQSDAANSNIRGTVTVALCTSADHHLLSQSDLSPSLYHHIPCDDPPIQLGYACHRVLRERINEADWFCYLEDDLLLHDSLLFQKLRWFQGVAGEDAVLLPNRYEIGAGPHVHRAYVDGDLKRETTAKWQNTSVDSEITTEFLNEFIRFHRPANPHSGCFFLSQLQMRRWASQPHFADRCEDFIGPLESAATLGLMQTFRVYKPAIENAGFLETQHQSNQFIRQLRPKG